MIIIVSYQSQRKLNLRQSIICQSKYALSKIYLIIFQFMEELLFGQSTFYLQLFVIKYHYLVDYLVIGHGKCLLLKGQCLEFLSFVQINFYLWLKKIIEKNYTIKSVQITKDINAQEIFYNQILNCCQRAQDYRSDCLYYSDNLIISNLQSQQPDVYQCKDIACLSCCKIVACFGIIFYVTMGFIVLGQTPFLKFQPEDQTATVVSCFITALLQILIVIGIVCYEKKQIADSISRQNYVDLSTQRESRPRESSMKGIALGDMAVLREGRESMKDN